MMPAVSIVVPVYGTEQYLPACLSSLLNQSMKNIEVIVVDDCSPGDVAEIVARTSGRDDRVRLVRHDTNKGLIQARLTGVRSATAEYVGFVDSDDTVEDRWAEALYAAAVADNADLVTCAMVVVDVGGFTCLENRGGDRHQLSGDEIMHSLLAGGMQNHLGTKLIRTTTWQSAVARLRDEWTTIGFAEDLLLTFLVVHEASRYAHVPDAGYRYMRRLDSMSTSPGVDSIAGRLDDLGRVYDVVRTLLQTTPQPAELVAKLFAREFEAVVYDLVRQLAALDGPAGLPATPTVLGAVIADDRQTQHPSSTADEDTSVSSADDVADLRAQHLADHEQLLRCASRLAEQEHRLAEAERALEARDAEIDELRRWRAAIERSRSYRVLRSQAALYDMPLIGPLLWRMRRVAARAIGRGAAGDD